MSTGRDRGIFDPKSVSRRGAAEDGAGPEVADLVDQAKRVGGPVANWRMRRAAAASNAALATRMLDRYFDARREELEYRVALALDAAKKRAIADNLADTAIIEKEIARMTAAIDGELTRSALDIEKEAAREEVRRVRDAQEMLARGEIAEARFLRLREAIEKRTDDVSARAHAVAQRVIENLGERLAAALRTAERRDR